MYSLSPNGPPLSDSTVLIEGERDRQELLPVMSLRSGDGAKPFIALTRGHSGELFESELSGMSRSITGSSST